MADVSGDAAFTLQLHVYLSVTELQSLLLI